MGKITGKINSPKFSEKLKKKIIEGCIGHLVNLRFNNEMIVGECINAYDKNGDIFGEFEMDNEFVIEGLKKGSFGFSISFIKFLDKNKEIYDVFLRHIAIFPKDRIP
jgi:hypothetical protein